MAYFRIKDAAEKVGVQPHVLRFWESQFPSHKPNKTSRGQRLYTDEDIESFVKIKHLLYDQGYSIPGAKKALKDEKQGLKTTPTTSANLSAEELLMREMLKETLIDLRKLQAFAKEI